jgi:flagellar hook-length control protein FliK
MQTNPLSNQAAGVAPQRANVNVNVDPGQFSAALSRELEQRQEMAPPQAAPAPKPATQAPQPQQTQQAQAEKSPDADAKAPAQDGAKAPAGDAAAKTDKTADAGEHKKDDKDTAEHPAAAQVTDMLALVASLNPSLHKGVTAAASAGQDPARGKTKGGNDALQLAALQSGAKTQAKDGEQTVKLVAADQSKNSAAAGLGATPGTDQKAGAKDGAFDLQAVQTAVADKLKAKPEAAQLGAQDRPALDAAALKDPAAAAPLFAQTQAAALQAAQAAAGVTSETIPARVGSAAWDQQVGQKIVWMVAGDEQSASLTLNPPDLGPMQVVLSVSNDQASVAFSSNQQEVRQALENALPRLREMMSESGIALGNATVNAGMPDQRQAQGGNQSGTSGGGSSRFDGGPAPIAEAAVRPAARVTTLGDRGMVDTFA